MQTVTIAELQANAPRLVVAAATDQVLITDHGRPAAFLLPVGEGEDVTAMVRDIRFAQMRRAVGQIRLSAKRSGTDKLTDTEIQAEIDEVRRVRRDP